MLGTDTSILKEAEELNGYLVRIRREIHANPELGRQEFNTAEIICRELDAIGCPYKDKVAGTGVMGLLSGKSNGRTIALRADMDALSIQEKNDVPYRSRVDGVMHACGHDAHVAILLGCCRLLKERMASLDGAVKFFFQPAEEGPGGALPMIEAGVMDNPRVERVVGLHLRNSQPVGTIGIKPGIASAAADIIEIIIRGKGGHAAHPHQAIDAIVISSAVIQSLQTIISRRISPMKPAVITIGAIHGGDRFNIIAETVKMTGTVRTLEEEVRDRIEELLRETISGLVAAYGGDFELKYERGYPPVINDPSFSAEIEGILVEFFGRDKVLILEEATMGGEDFAYFSRLVPSLFLRLGSRMKAKDVPHHHASFDFDEDAMMTGVAAMSKIVVDFLSGKISEKL